MEATYGETQYLRIFVTWTPMASYGGLATYGVWPLMMGVIDAVGHLWRKPRMYLFQPLATR